MPAGASRDIPGKLHAGIVRIPKLPDVQKRFQGEGGTVSPDTPEQFGTFFKSEIAKWGKAVRDSGARADRQNPDFDEQRPGGRA